MSGESPATDQPSAVPEQCAQHETVAVGACIRCGDYYCDDCAGDPPSRALCRRCDRIVGNIPWEHDRESIGSLRAWARTVTRLLSAHRVMARSLPVDGSLRPPITFALIAWGAHVVLSALMIGAIRWTQFSFSLARFGAEDAVGRIVVSSDYPHLVMKLVLVLPFVILLAPVGLSGAARVMGGNLSHRASARIVAYTCGYLVWAGIPLCGIAVLFLLPNFLYRALGARTQLSPLRRGMTVCLAAAFTILVRIAGEAIYSLTLAPLVSEQISDALASI